MCVRSSILRKLEKMGWVEHPRRSAIALAFRFSYPLSLTISTEAFIISSLRITIFLGIK